MKEPINSSHINIGFELWTVYWAKQIITGLHFQRMKILNYASALLIGKCILDLLIKQWYLFEQVYTGITKFKTKFKQNSCDLIEKEALSIDNWL